MGVRLILELVKLLIFIIGKYFYTCLRKIKCYPEPEAFSVLVI